MTVRSTLAKALRVKAHDLEQELTGLVAVVVGLDHLGIGAADDLRGPEQALAPQPCGRLVVSLPPD